LWIDTEKHRDSNAIAAGYTFRLHVGYAKNT
jgi:hypothetical protein